MSSYVPKSIIIIGAGIAGLACAIPLSRQGHNVTILESKPELNEFGASIGIQPNGVKILKAWGLGPTFTSLVEPQPSTSIHDGHTGALLGTLTSNAHSTNRVRYGEDTWTVHRADYQRILADYAVSHGARILFSSHVTRIDTATITVHLFNDTTLSADLIIGADGMRSATRASIPSTSSITPIKLSEDCSRCSVPKERMVSNPLLAPLLASKKGMIYTTPGKYILTWPLYPGRPYDVVTCVQRESTVPPGQWGIVADSKEMAKDFDDFCPEVRELLANVDQCIRWALGELPALSSCRSEDGRIVLVGDAWHAMIPHSASGGNSAVEDGACLGECVAYALENGFDIPDATKAFEAIRKPRVERMQVASHDGMGFLSAGGEEKEKRDAYLASRLEVDAEEVKRPEEERRKDPKPKANMNAPFPSPPYLAWLYQYDAVGEARGWCQDHMGKGGREVENVLVAEGINGVQAF